jgi:hypothetical protein
VAFDVVTSVKAFVTSPTASANLAVKLYVLAIVGMPDSRPVVDKLTPGGRFPEATDQTYGGAPPTPTSCTEYGCVRTPAGRDVEEIISRGAVPVADTLIWPQCVVLNRIVPSAATCSSVTIGVPSHVAVYRVYGAWDGRPVTNIGIDPLYEVNCMLSPVNVVVDLLNANTAVGVCTTLNELEAAASDG